MSYLKLRHLKEWKLFQHVLHSASGTCTGRHPSHDLTPQQNLYQWIVLWVNVLSCKSYWCLYSREFSGMIPVITSNNHPSNPQQPIHSLRLAPVRNGFQSKSGIQQSWPVLNHSPMHLVQSFLQRFVLIHNLHLEKTAAAPNKTLDVRGEKTPSFHWKWVETCTAQQTFWIY